MTINYNKLMELLIDKGLTKIEMRKRASINTSVLDKIEKNETVSMNTFARIAAVMECRLDNIVELNTKKKRAGE